MGRTAKVGVRIFPHDGERASGHSAFGYGIVTVSPRHILHAAGV